MHFLDTLSATFCNPLISERQAMNARLAVKLYMYLGL